MDDDDLETGALGALVYGVDFFTGEERAGQRGGHIRPYVDWGNRRLYAELVGTVRDMTPANGENTRQPQDPALGYLFSEANATLDDVLAVDRTDNTRAVAESTAGLAPLAIGATVICKVAMMREEHLTGLGTAICPLYSRGSGVNEAAHHLNADLGVRINYKYTTIVSLLSPSMAYSLLPHPSSEFYLANSDPAVNFISFNKYEKDFELTLVLSTTQGNTWHYRTCKDGSLWRALLFGEVVGHQKVTALLGERQHGEREIVKLTVKCIPNPSPKIAQLFAEDHMELLTIVESESSHPPSAFESWVGTEAGDKFFIVDYSPFTTVVNGPVSNGSNILVDASFRRVDIRHAGPGSCKNYLIIAHEIECISDAYLGSFGVTGAKTEDVEFENILELGAVMEGIRMVIWVPEGSGVLLDHAMIVENNYGALDNFIRLVRSCQYDGHTEEYFTRISNDVLFLAAMKNAGCWERVMRWIRSISYGPVDLSQAGVLAALPAELVYRIVGHMTLKSRVRFSMTCKDVRYLCASLAHFDLGVICANYHLDFTEVRFMLVATQTCMAGFALQSIFSGPVTGEDSLDFFARAVWAEEVVAFLLKSERYTADPMSMSNGGYTTTVLRSSTHRIRVIGCPSTALQGVTSQNHSARFGYCDGYRIRHAYAELMDERITLTTPNLLPIADDLAAHGQTWETVHKALRHGLTWVFEYGKPHDCRDKLSFSCPANLRDTLDGGWFQMYLFDTAYGANKTIELIAWPFFGLGCRNGTIRGRKFKKVVCDTAYSKMRSFPHYVLGALVKYLEERPNALFKARHFSSFDWVNVSVNSMALRGTTVGMAMIPDKEDGDRVSFTLFGAVKSVRSDGTIVIGRPRWHTEGSAGIALVVRYDEQLLALARALESRNLCGSFDDNEIVLTTHGLSGCNVGNVVCATATLSVEEEIDFAREEHYTLTVKEITVGTNAFCFPPVLTAQWVLWKYDVDVWRWTPTEGGIVARRETEHANGGIVLRPIEFNLFGMVSGSPRPGVLRLSKPVFVGTLGRELSILFDMQLWTLTRILERIGLDGILEDDDFVVVNGVGNVANGATIIATATLLIRIGDHDEVEDYELKLQKIHTMVCGLTDVAEAGRLLVRRDDVVGAAICSSATRAKMASIWPRQLDSLKLTLEYLEKNTTASIANSEYNIDFSPPAANGNTAYVDIDTEPYHFWVFGQALSTVEAQHGRLAFKLGAGGCQESMAFFKRQLYTLALPVREDDDVDTDLDRNMQGEPATDWDRINLSSRSFIEIQIAERMARRAKLYIPGGPCTLRECDAWYPSDFAFNVGDWMLVYATLHRKIDNEKKKRVYTIVAGEMRKLRFDGEGSGTESLKPEASAATRGAAGGAQRVGTMGLGGDGVEIAPAVLSFENATVSEPEPPGRYGDPQTSDDATLSSGSSTEGPSALSLPAKRPRQQTRGSLGIAEHPRISEVFVSHGRWGSQALTQVQLQSRMMGVGPKSVGNREKRMESS
ncbi:hypothetical protein C8F04DRAFT_1195529 [Mycena alexandri]|uniref:F-box domain-containing protein n=1 Tax=Mycena alexandri TaxID=1745969 RepID=A0AAD6S926_9AGAR|nr:hypothetical protein C8F04DRAFT_1195529 [Mycena alexandri]